MIFIDTTFWIGDADANDDFHGSAHAVIEGVRKGELSHALTTDYVLNETVTILGRRRGFGVEKASRVAFAILSSPRVLTVFLDEVLLRESLALYPKFAGKLGITDVSSIAVMNKYGVKDIFSHDRDFDSAPSVRRRESFKDSR